MPGCSLGAYWDIIGSVTCYVNIDLTVFGFFLSKHKTMF